MTVHTNPQTLPIVFQFEETSIRTFIRDDEPWFVGRDICAALGIKNSNDALARLDADERGVAITDPPRGGSLGGGTQEVTTVSEPGVYRLVFTSRTPKAESFKRWLAHEVLTSIRRTGRYSIVADEPEDGRLLHGYNRWQMAALIEMLKLASKDGGPQTMWKVWDIHKLPNVRKSLISHVVETPADDPRGCFNHLCRIEARCGGTMGSLIDLALRDEPARSLLRSHGISVDISGKTGSVSFSDTHPFLRQAFARTQWAGEWKRALILLDGASRTTKALSFNGNRSLAVKVPRETVLNLRNHGAI